MAILFDWYENPKTKDKQGEELTLHPRIKLNGSTTTDELRRHIQEYCSLTETDVLAVLDALSHFVGRELGEGRQVHLDGIGYFVPTLTCTEPVTLETKRKSTKVKLKNITFRPDKALRSEIGVLKVKPLKLRNLTKKRLTDDEVKQKVVNYLRKNEFITRSVVQSICGMTRTTATRQIRRLCEDQTRAAAFRTGPAAVKGQIFCARRKEMHAAGRANDFLFSGDIERRRHVVSVWTAVACQAREDEAQAVEEFCSRSKSTADPGNSRPLVHGERRRHIKHFVNDGLCGLRHAAPGVG
jgi:predicted histone-like DNA-binding protein